jgi:peptidoglycan/LPS O-acetylase OafA/YrhL
MEKQTGNSSRISAFDTVRGLAALSVVFSHYVLAYGLPTESRFWRQAWTYTPLHIIWDGFAAVSLFYILSGFVLSLKHFRATKQPDISQFKMADYIARRIFRIWPPYLVIFVISYLLRRFVGANEAATVPAAGKGLFAAWDSLVPFTQVLRESLLLHWGDYFIVPQGWTLPIELLISLLIPVGVLLAARHTGWLIFFTLVLIGPLQATYFIYHFTLGVLIAKFYQDIQAWLEPGRGWKLVLLLIGIFLYTFRYTLPVLLRWALPDGVIWIVTGSGAALLLLVVIGSAHVKTFLSFAWFRFVGRVSYSVYLIHYLVLILLTPLALTLLHAPKAYSHLAWAAGLIFTVAATLALAALSYRWIEVPSMTLGKSLAKILREQWARKTIV